MCFCWEHAWSGTPFLEPWSSQLAARSICRFSTEDDLHLGTVVGNAKQHYAQTWHQSSLSSVVRYQPLQPGYVLAPHLPAVKGFMNRKLISRLRCGCHGLHVDTGTVGFCIWHSKCLGSNVIVFLALLVQQRMHHMSIILCLIALEHFHKHPLPRDSWGPAPELSSLLTLHPKSWLGFWRNVLHIGTP